MDQSTMWWIGVVVLLIFELVTGTFYLLMLALGLAVAALAAHAGAGFPAQLSAAAVVGAGAAAAWYAVRARRPSPTSESLNLDVGQALTIIQWDAQHEARIRYRGAEWVAVLKAGCVPSASGHYQVTAIEGSRLVVEPTHNA